MSVADRGREADPVDLVDVRPLVQRVVEARVRDRHTVDDLVQETLARVMAAADRLDDTALAPYAVATARNLVSSLGRQQERDRRHRHRLVELAAPDDPDEDVLRHEEEAALAVAFSRLPAPDRRALASHEVEGTAMSSLAEESRSTAGAVAVGLARARAKLRVEYVLALRRVDLPTPRCKAVLLALSSGDRRGQRRVGAAEHVLECECCASLSEPLLKRSRPLAGLWPALGLGGLIRRAARWAGGHPVPAAGAATAAAAVAVVAVLVNQPDPGSLRAGTRSLLPLRPGILATVAQQQVEGRSLEVGRVVRPTAFWVGTGPRDRVFIEVEGPPPFPVTPGQEVDFVGRVQVNHADPAQRFGMGGEDADELRRQGHHIDVDARALRRA